MVRNRIRRRVYAAIRSLLSDLEPKMYLVIVRSGTEKFEMRSLAAELAELFKKSYNH